MSPEYGIRHPQSKTLRGESVPRGPASVHIGNNEIHSNSELELDRARLGDTAARL